MEARPLQLVALVAAALCACSDPPPPRPTPLTQPVDAAFTEALLAEAPPGTQFRDVAFAPGGAAVAYGAMAEDGARVYLNGLPQGSRPLSGAKLFLGPRGKRVGFFAFPKGERSHHVGLDGKLSPPYAKVWPPIFSPDGKRVAHGIKRDGEEQERMVVDGTTGEPFENVYVPVFSSDGTQLVYPARTGKRYWLVRDGKRGPVYDGVWHPAFHPSAPLVAFGARRGDRRFVVIEGVEGPPFDEIGDPVWSPDGGRVVYPAKVLTQWKLATARVTRSRGRVRLAHELDRRAFDAIGLPTFGPSGTVGFVAERAGSSLLVVGGTIGSRRDRFNHTLLRPNGERRSPLVLDVGGRWACGITPPNPDGGIGLGKGDQRVVIDGRRGRAFARVGRPVFSPDGKHVAYAAGPPGGPAYLVLGDRFVGPYDRVGPPRFSADSKWVAFGTLENGRALHRRVAQVR